MEQDSVFAISEDLANQLKHWDVYKSHVEAAHLKRGQFLCPEAAEWFSGQLGVISTAHFFAFTLWADECYK